MCIPLVTDMKTRSKLNEEPTQSLGRVPSLPRRRGGGAAPSSAPAEAESRRWPHLASAAGSGGSRSRNSEGDQTGSERKDVHSDFEAQPRKQQGHDD